MTEWLPVTVDDRAHDPKLLDNWSRYAKIIRAWDVPMKFAGITIAVIIFIVVLLYLNKKWGRGQDPYNMTEAADHLEKLADGQLERLPLLNVDRQV